MWFKSATILIGIATAISIVRLPSIWLHAQYEYSERLEAFKQCVNLSSELSVMTDQALKDLYLACRGIAMSYH